LLAERYSGLTQALPGIAQILGEISRQSRLGRSPTVVLFSFLDPLLAVVALSTCHIQILTPEEGSEHLQVN
jgi:hypothetical protein